MHFSTLMVHLDLGISNETLLKVTADMAERFSAGVIGITACQPMLIFYGEGDMATDILEKDRADIRVHEVKAELQFRAVLRDRVPNLRWHSEVGYMPLAECIADQARGADLLLVAPEREKAVIDPSRRASLSDLVMRMGRPVIVVPPSLEALDLQHVVIGWKDTRETRGAVLSALPLLRSAGQVTVVEIASDIDRMAATSAHLGEVVTWLQGHGVKTDFVAEPSTGDDVARIDVIATERRAGLLVIGAYGHTRLREWVLGGMTRDVLRNPSRMSFLSH